MEENAWAGMIRMGLEEMDLMKNFVKAKEELYTHVGFKEDWVIYAIEDRIDMYWKIMDREIIFAETLEKLNSDGDYYNDEIYPQRFYRKHVYEGKELTMIFVDTHTDGNKFFAFFSNDKRVQDSPQTV